MGEIAEMMLDGTLCQSCGTFIGSDNGFATLCSSCEEEGECSGEIKIKVGTSEKRRRKKIKRIVANTFQDSDKILLNQESWLKFLDSSIVISADHLTHPKLKGKLKNGDKITGCPDCGSQDFKYEVAAL